MAAKPCWRFRSWDRTILAKPFARIAMVFGPPIWAAAAASAAEMEAARQDLEDTLNPLTAAASEYLERCER